MLKNTERIIDSELSSHVFQDIDLANLYRGSSARRYGLVNKALRAHELIRLRRGLYMLALKYQKSNFSLYYLANHIVPYSFVTAESALQFHQWIPERTSQVTSVAAFGRERQFANVMGQFVYLAPPITSLDKFFIGVLNQQIEDQAVWIATPLRALIDYVLWHKIDNANLQFLNTSLRIEEEYLNTIKKEDIKSLAPIYKSKRVAQFLKNLLHEVNA